MKPLNALIIDDEQDSIKLLQLQLKEHCPWVTVTGSFVNPVHAIPEIDRLQPEILFLDIEMPGMNGFQLLDKLLHQNPGIVFITAYNQYALKAFRYNALDYLVKPIEAEELVRVVQKVERLARPGTEQISMLQRQLRGEQVSKIAIPGQSGVSFIGLEEIIYAESSNNYTVLVLQNKQRFIVAKTLKDVQGVLEEFHFMRIHRQYIINLNHVLHLNRMEGMVTMSNKASLLIAKHQKEKLIARYGLL
ncbi:MAG: LytTR family DNA-binding domain-containing protein [Chitinophagaceae bacterium]